MHDSCNLRPLRQWGDSMPLISTKELIMEGLLPHIIGPRYNPLWPPLSGSIFVCHMIFPVVMSIFTKLLWKFLSTHHNNVPWFLLQVLGGEVLTPWLSVCMCFHDVPWTITKSPLWFWVMDLIFLVWMLLEHNKGHLKGRDDKVTHELWIILAFITTFMTNCFCFLLFTNPWLFRNALYQ
jgi:hypothetical protein